MFNELERAGITVFERGWLSSNNVLLHGTGDEAATIVDTGYWIHSAQTIALLRQALQGAPLGRIINTHLHSDHCGGNAAIQAAFGCSIDVPAGEAAAVDAWDESKLTYRATGQHCPCFRRSGSIVAPGELQPGRWSWRALASPGHDPMSFALYQPDLQLLISADALWENGFGVVFPELEGEDAFDDVAATLDQFAALPVRWVIPGHGKPFSDVSSAIDRARRRLEGFVADPRKHALHAAKVLIKFRLLEMQATSWPELDAWLQATPYFGAVIKAHFPGVDPVRWSRSLVDDMCRSGALRADAQQIFNI